jgi:hypothetical protein
MPPGRKRSGTRPGRHAAAASRLDRADAITLVNTVAENARSEDENQGLDLANTPGIRPDGSIIMPEYPTPEQDAYIARRVALRIKREWAENQRIGIKDYPKIRPLRTGDLVP